MVEEVGRGRKILLVDHEDSFVHTLAGYIRRTGAEVVTMRHDYARAELRGGMRPDLVVLSPGPGNPLGTRWMGLSSPGVGIHGTDDPSSIGYSVSHDCIRMQIPDAERLFTMVSLGMSVYIHA